MSEKLVMALRAKPPCFDRKPRAAGRWHHVGRRADGRPVLRWCRRWFEDRCVTWDCPEGTTPSPVLAGWNCAGCRWEPGESIQFDLVDWLMRMAADEQRKAAGSDSTIARRIDDLRQKQ